jgi:hypothetical protein
MFVRAEEVVIQRESAVVSKAVVHVRVRDGPCHVHELQYTWGGCSI